MYCLAQQKLSSGGVGSDSDSEDSDARAAAIPALFQDAGYAILGHSTLSTSNCGNPSLAFFGFGPVVPDGFGIGCVHFLPSPVSDWR